MCLDVCNFSFILTTYSFCFLHLGPAYLLLSFIPKCFHFFFFVPLVNGMYSSVNRGRYREILSSAIHSSILLSPLAEGSWFDKFVYCQLRRAETIPSTLQRFASAQETLKARSIFLLSEEKPWLEEKQQ